MPALPAGAPIGADAADLIAAAIEGVAGAGKPFVLGICGAQGSGKSTIAALLAKRLGARGRRAAILSLDDLYLSGAQRQALAETVHPLLRTRGVPGTHDVALGLSVIEGLGRRCETLVPRFDKRSDEPGAPEPFTGPADLLILEGWCVGARPEDPAALARPANTLERERDPDGTWRRYVNDQLAGPYRALFDRIDFLALLKAPGFDVVADWRIEQERNAGGPMSDGAVRHFVEHYRRLTEHVLRDGEAWADLSMDLDAKRRILDWREAKPVPN